MIAIMFFSACKKEDNGPPPLNSTSMRVGKAGIRFTANTAFNGNKNFDLVNTNETTATTITLSGGTIKNIKVEATEIIDNLPSRKVLIDFVVREVSTINLFSFVRFSIRQYQVRELFSFWHHPQIGFRHTHCNQINNDRSRR